MSFRAWALVALALGATICSAATTTVSVSSTASHAIPTTLCECYKHLAAIALTRGCLVGQMFEVREQMHDKDDLVVLM
jgi:hypothetical protein